MEKFKFRVTECFSNDLRQISKNHDYQKRLSRKIEEILKAPFHYKPLRNILKNKRRTHIGSYVLIFEIDKDHNTVIFHSFKHHDEAYE